MTMRILTIIGTLVAVLGYGALALGVFDKSAPIYSRVETSTRR